MREIAAIYSRISHDPEGRQAGVERQEQDCRLLAHERGWEVLERPYRENDTSASTRSRTKRPVFERLLADAAAGRFSILLAYSTSRLTRRPLEYERLIALTTATSLQIQTVVSGPVRLDAGLFSGQWPALLTRAQWDAVRLVLLDPRRDTRTFRQVAKRYSLAGLLVCGRCDHLLVTNPLRGVPSFICSPTANKGCGKIRIAGEPLEQFLLARIRERDAAALELPAQRRLRQSLRQLQDDHYDGLLDRSDYLRQSHRLRSAVAPRTGVAQVDAVLADTDKRSALRAALDRVVVLPHPRGRAPSRLTGPQREALLNDRLQLHWHAPLR